MFRHHTQRRHPLKPRVTTRNSLARKLARLFFVGRGTAFGPPRVGAFLDESQLHKMFETLGGTYDAQNRILSLGRDAQWRKILVEKLHTTDGQLVIDMATGTGEVAIAIVRRYSGVRVIAIDYSPRMLAEARRKLGTLPSEISRRTELRRGDIRCTDVEDSTADVPTNTFALRNLPDRAPVLAEFFRLLKPGGKLFIMEPGLPDTPLVRFVYSAYLSHLMPFFGNILSRTDYAYSYLRHSIEAFPRPQEFVQELTSAGFMHAKALRLSFGIAVLYSAIRGDGR